MKQIKLLIIGIIALFVFLIAKEPDNWKPQGVSNSQLVIDRHIGMMATVPIKITGAVGVDTITTAVIIPRFAHLRQVSIVVADTVESRGDSALVKVLVGTTEVLSQMTSAFKLGVSTAPRMFDFTPAALFTPLAGGTISYRITQTAGSAGTGILEGTWYLKIYYDYPFENYTLP